MPLRHCSQSSSQRGFTLIEIAISLIILGVLITPLIVLFNQHQQKQRVVTTHENVQGAMNAIQNFVKMHGRYPCPAPLNQVTRSEPAYGREHATACDGPAASGLSPGACGGGICVEESVRILENPRVIVGMLPFRELQIEENRAKDAYGSRLVYAVTESMTSSETFNPNTGAISIVNTQGKSQVSPPGSVAYLVLSPGKTGSGGYDIFGALKSPCSTGAVEDENCNIGFESGAAASPDAVYLSSLKNDVVGSGFYDDVLMFFSSTLPPTWGRTPADRDNIVDLSGRFVGVGTNSPTFNLDISSKTKDIDSLAIYGDTAGAGTLFVDELCNENGGDCFRTSVLTAPADGIPDNDEALECPAGEYLLRVEFGRAVCSDSIDMACPSGKIMKGLNANGTMNCIDVPLRPCLAADLASQQPLHTNICGTPITVPDLAHGQKTNDGSVLGAAYTNYQNRALNAAGKPVAAGPGPFNCKTFYFECQDGNWLVRGEKGACGWTDPPAEPLDPGSCGIGFTGTVARSEQLHCDSTKSILSAPAGSPGNQCTCNAGVDVTSTPACNTLTGWAANATGNARVYYNVSCPNGDRTGPFTDTSGCGCPATNTTGESRWVATGSSCPTGWLGTPDATLPAGASGYAHPLQKKQTYTDTCTWADTPERRGYCSCNLEPREIKRDPTCAQNVCNKKVTDWVRIAQVDATTCSVEPEANWTDKPGFEDTAARCTENPFKLLAVRRIGENTTGKLPTGARFVDGPCSCSEFTNGTTPTCYKSPTDFAEMFMCSCSE